ncbi:acyltransferase family [Plasmopara halstedii]|uniref:Acyltransferase family n=1 Tax=Plasmopara halstedii TaxID=4781 RepID=A0A0P1B334_PLAHL|nr:acyltransferase family [Plasmopara halstedii]CEG48260.1 acyltransferase family [Plasmopara halstedii]|eukprot:XP_024584629.1 acyltransferase family [Plasmopara halstedii]
MLDSQAKNRTIEQETNVSLNVQTPLEDQPLLIENEHDKNNQTKLTEPKMTATPAPPPTKALFLDGLRGLAALLVVAQHSHEYIQGINIGATAVDTFFVLSSFLLTWLFINKSVRLLNEGAGLLKWGYMLIDYFSKRFFRVYPLFAFTCITLWFMDDGNRTHYFLKKSDKTFDLFKTLTFDFEHRYFVFWTLPLEISYYFIIPVFVLGTLMLHKYWWLPFLPAYYWVITQGWSEYRTSHSKLLPHIPTFLAGSMAATIYVKLNMWIIASGFEFRFYHKVLLRLINYTAFAVFLSVAFHGLFFVWVHENVAPQTPGFHFVSVLLTIIIVCEMLLPSPLSSILEWSFLRYWGKISFSVYLLHGFVVYNKTLSHQGDYYCRLFSRFGVLGLLATVTYYLVEYPSQKFAQRITKILNEQEAKGSRSMNDIWSGWSKQISISLRNDLNCKETPPV